MATFVCLYIDLDNSSGLSFEHHPKVMAKIYDYFTQNIVDIITGEPFDAAYIDIKGDGVFGIFEGEKAAIRAFNAGLTFKTFFEKHIRPKFQKDGELFNCKLAISKDKILVKKIGLRGNNNEVWAGRVVNNAAKLASLTKSIYANNKNIDPSVHSLLVISGKVHDELIGQAPILQNHCGHDPRGNTAPKTPAWVSVDCSMDSSVYDNVAWYAQSIWCDICGDKYFSEVLN